MNTDIVDLDGCEKALSRSSIGGETLEAFSSIARSSFIHFDGLLPVHGAYACRLASVFLKALKSSMAGATEATKAEMDVSNDIDCISLDDDEQVCISCLRFMNPRCDVSGKAVKKFGKSIFAFLERSLSNFSEKLKHAERRCVVFHVSAFSDLLPYGEDSMCRLSADFLSKPKTVDVSVKVEDLCILADLCIGRSVAKYSADRVQKIRGVKLDPISAAMKKTLKEEIDDLRSDFAAKTKAETTKRDLLLQKISLKCAAKLEKIEKQFDRKRQALILKADKMLDFEKRS